MLIKLLLIYLVIINLITFIIFGADKRAAIKGKQRIREATLLLFAFIGGSLGGLVAIYLFRHKTRKPKFTVTIPLMLILQIAAILYFLKVC
ncbi:MAG: DUF1294 domain-containing protein [Clostridia bacterium]|nr:DUF1294 domain-containing protein [Clostridia bacterium]